jgi:hypothetical protein
LESATALFFTRRNLYHNYLSRCLFFPGLDLMVLTSQSLPPKEKCAAGYTPLYTIGVHPRWSKHHPRPCGQRHVGQFLNLEREKRKYCSQFTCSQKCSCPFALFPSLDLVVLTSQSRPPKEVCCGLHPLINKRGAPALVKTLAASLWPTPCLTVPST